MSVAKDKLRVIISGGGTGGHVFPAIAIGNALKAKLPDAEILFVGAKGKMEMEKVPKAGFPIKGLWISGLHRKLTLRNLMFPFKVLSSLFRSWGILRKFKPDVVVGVGGFASGPVLEVASRMNYPTLIQEQNSYAGITNRLLAKKVDRICVAYDGMEKYFPKEKLILTGNPVRKDLEEAIGQKEKGLAHFGLEAGKKTLFVFGGSLGAQSLNEAMAANAELLKEHQEIQVLWQLGKLYVDRFQDCDSARLPNVKAQAFIDRMDLAFAMADLVICRAGASTISELCLVSQAAILVPSPNVAEDHQTYNAQALVKKDAAALVPDKQAADQMIHAALELMENEERRAALSRNIGQLARPEAAMDIAGQVIALATEASK